MKTLRYAFIVASLPAVLSLAACEDPAKDKPKATVEAPKTEAKAPGTGAAAAATPAPAAAVLDIPPARARLDPPVGGLPLVAGAGARRGPHLASGSAAGAASLRLRLRVVTALPPTPTPAP